MNALEKSFKKTEYVVCSPHQWFKDLPNWKFHLSPRDFILDGGWNVWGFFMKKDQVSWS